ncbi:O-methylsterigmatocystin oxidoreductase, partial [Leucoagaricus sp. SymC.cos]
SYQYLRKPAWQYAPGPKRLPMIGNAFDVPAHRPWVKFLSWSRIYGDLVYLRIFGRHVLVLHSVEAVTDLFEKRFEMCADRPQRAMANLCGYGRTMILRKQDDETKRSRRLLQGQLNARAISAYAHIQENEARALARNLLHRSDDFRKLIRRSLFFFILAWIAYGYEVKEEDDHLVPIAEQAMNNLSKAVAPNRYWVDSIPSRALLRGLRPLLCDLISPRFVSFLAGFPGAGFQREAAACKKVLEQFIYGPFSKVKADMATGSVLASYASNLLSNSSGTLRPEDEDLYAWTAGEIFGDDPQTISITSSFILAMVLFPEVQRNAQAEIDSVAGVSKLPFFSDRGALPYVNVVVKEAMRWNPVISTVLASILVGRTTRKDDIYRGYLVSVGTLVMANVWGITYDDQVYPQPYTFKLERYLNTSEPCLDPRTTIVSVVFLSQPPLSWLILLIGLALCVGR